MCAAKVVTKSNRGQFRNPSERNRMQPATAGRSIYSELAANEGYMKTTVSWVLNLLIDEACWKQYLRD